VTDVYEMVGIPCKRCGKKYIVWHMPKKRCKCKRDYASIIGKTFKRNSLPVSHQHTKCPGMLRKANTVRNIPACKVLNITSTYASKYHCVRKKYYIANDNWVIKYSELRRYYQEV